MFVEATSSSLLSFGQFTSENGRISVAASSSDEQAGVNDPGYNRANNRWARVLYRRGAHETME
jgi:hypothetical protein